jgi:hypothetical protein
MNNFNGFLLNSVSVVFVFTKADEVLINGKKQKDRRFTLHSSELKHGLYRISDLSMSGWKMVGVFPDNTRNAEGKRINKKSEMPKERERNSYNYGIPEYSFRVETGKRVLIMVEERRSVTHNRFFRQWTMKLKLERVRELVSKGMCRKEAIKQAIKIQYVDR